MSDGRTNWTLQRGLVPPRVLAAWDAAKLAAEAAGDECLISPLAWRWWWQTQMHGKPLADRRNPWGRGYSARLSEGRVWEADRLLIYYVRPKPPERQPRGDLATRFQAGSAPGSRPVVTPSGRYASAGLAARAYGISRQSAAIRCARGSMGWGWAR